MKTLGFGLIGYGAWGKCHAQAIRETSGCELRAVAAASEASRKAASEETSAEVYADYRELVSRDDLDVVDIVVPNYLHEEVATAALAAGRNVLLEKPMSVSAESCDRIIAAARASGKLLLIGHEMRFSPMYVAMHEIIQSGRLGVPRYILADLWRRPYRTGSDGWRMDPARVGNWILEEPVHFFEATAWLLNGAGQPSTVYAFGNRRESGAVVDTNDNFTAVVTYPNQAYAVISQTLAAVEHHFSLKVFGSKGMLRAEWHAEMDRSEKPSYSLEVSSGIGMEAVHLNGTPGELFELRQEMSALANALRDGAPLPITPDEGRRAVMLCMEAQRSLATGKVITLSA